MNRYLITMIMLFGLIVPDVYGSTDGPYDSDLDKTLNEWNRARSERQSIIDIKLKEATIARTKIDDPMVSDSASAIEAFNTGELYSELNIDSAIVFFGLSQKFAMKAGLSQQATLARIKLLSLMPLKNLLTKEVVDRFEMVNTDDLTGDARVQYYIAACRFYNIIAMNTPIPPLRDYCTTKYDDFCDSVISHTPEDDPIHNLMTGIRYRREDKPRLSLAAYMMALDSCQAPSLLYSHISLHVARNHMEDGNLSGAILYGLRSDLSEIECGTLRGNASLFLSDAFLEKNDIPKAYDAMGDAMGNAVRSGDMLKTLISTSYYYRVNQKYAAYYLHRQHMVIGLLSCVLFLALADTIFLIWRARARRRRQTRQTAEILDTLRSDAQADQGDAELKSMRVSWLSGCLDLCSEYLSRIDTFRDAARRKISTGQTTEVLQKIKSGDFIDENPERFLQIFDSVFLSIYPRFVEELNALMDPDKQLVLTNPSRLTNEIRVYAFMRMGVDDTVRIARFLGVSVNTVYTYRNKMRQRAIDRDSLMEFVRMGQSAPSEE